MSSLCLHTEDTISPSFDSGGYVLTLPPFCGYHSSITWLWWECNHSASILRIPSIHHLTLVGMASLCLHSEDTIAPLLDTGGNAITLPIALAMDIITMPSDSAEYAITLPAYLIEGVVTLLPDKLGHHHPTWAIPVFSPCATSGHYASWSRTHFLSLSSYFWAVFPNGKCEHCLQIFYS